MIVLTSGCVVAGVYEGNILCTIYTTAFVYFGTFCCHRRGTRLAPSHDICAVNTLNEVRSTRYPGGGCDLRVVVSNR